ncbi:MULTISPECIES: hypothetical protein [unclassified Colwellia]|uniref:hypothetical protein n=1 Tax=unclassified Colwellia TaxID=196834 RepID=UPI0015F768E1|nr:MULTISPECIES: hypothetical protein [unclassified Colwellia]MBA6232220.1 hypothetical protein [Colwellia sp. MB02u-7]MBA6238207.1 hypothetical protein [Colwellia sp. MB02u-11]MBA6254462.1 hypothetical protein [Colwellia sp. MB3u-28]MBA6262101.1 hypothetical protein [Colwellia sp. MB3u-41]MBA6299656.1 hypothetical protein [Colwellia sp. MB3u-22]
MTKIPDDFIEIVEIKKIKVWAVKKCTKCNESFYFMFRQGSVFYDNSCDCSQRDKSRKSSWGEVAEVYNKPESKELAEKYQTFWQLD